MVSIEDETLNNTKELLKKQDSQTLIWNYNQTFMKIGLTLLMFTIYNWTLGLVLVTRTSKTKG